MARRPHSQVFLHERGIIDRFASVIPAEPGDPLVEIGPGAGAITRALIAAGHRVVGVEVDSRLAPGVADLGPSVRVVVGSILDFRPRDLSVPPVRIVGALPYHLSGAILRWLADWADEVAFAAVILQDEVVERMGAPPGHPSRGLLSVILQSVYEVKPLFRISPGAFVPAPKVWSRAVVLSRRADAAPVVALTPVWDLARAVFQHRRKMIRTGIARAYGEDACRRAEMSHVDLTLRAERLSLTDLETLATALTRGA